MANEQISIDQATAQNTAAANATLRKLKEAVEAELGRSRQSARALCDQLVPGALEALAEADPAALSRMKISDFHDLLRAHLTSVQVTGRLVDATQLTALERENAALRKERDDLRKQRDSLQAQLQARKMTSMMVAVPSVAPAPSELPSASLQDVHATAVVWDEAEHPAPSPLSAVFPTTAPASNDVRLYTLSVIAGGEHRWSLIKRSLEAAGFTAGNDFIADLDDLVVSYEVTTPRLSYLLDLSDAGREFLKARAGFEAPPGVLSVLLSRFSSPDLVNGALWIAPHLSDVDYEGADIAGLRPALRTRAEGPVFVIGDENLSEPAEIGACLREIGGVLYAVALDRSVSSTLVTRFTLAVEDAALVGEAVLYLTNVTALMAGTKNEQGQVWVTTHRVCHRHPVPQGPSRVGKGRRS